LLEFVVDLLNKNQTILNACKKQYQKVLVDEFQDTNYLQEELLKLLVFNNGILQNKKICIVGDVKQSIYRFRGAEARIMIDWQNKIFNNENSVVIFLSQNRRSVKTIVDFVNGLFTQIMAGSQNDGTLIKYDPHHKMTSAREDIQNNSFAVEFILLDFNGANAVNKTNCDTADNDDADQEQLDITNCYLEGLALAKKINELVGNFYVLDKRTDNLKKCQYKDITVLLRSFNNVKQYEQALREKNIPFYTVKGRGFFECYEIIDIINFLKLVVNPNNFNILIAVLRSPFMFLSDDQIYLIVKQLQENIEVSNLYFDENYFSEIDKNRINDFFKFLNYYNHCFSEMSIAELLRVIFEKFEYCEFLAAQFNAEKKLANVNKLIDLAIAYTNTRNINNFIEWLDKLTEQSSSENEAELIDENANVVKIMTVHQSKGLEFPIIIVPNTNRGAVNNKDFVRFSRTEFYIKLKNLIGKDFNNENFDKINIHEKIADTEEEHRIFYTACTRARDCLILMAVRNIKYKGYKETYAQKIEDYIKKLKSEKIKFSEIKKMSELDFNNAETKELEISEDIITKKFLKLQELKKLDYLELKEWDFSVVEFAKFILSCQNSNNNFIADDWLKSENIDEIAKLKNSDIADGLFAHFILKNFDFYNNANNNLNKYLDDYNDKNNISNPAKIYENIIAAVETLKNKLSDFYEFVIEKELPFVLRLKAKDYTIRLHGVIDVLFYNENKIVLVDYKYSTFKEENQQYKIQMMIYALALFEIFGKYPDEIYICYLCDNDKLRLLNISNDDLKIFSEEIFRYLKEYNKLLISGKYEN
ncbi:MAG TPA: 3'-5' exonuclease, partial [bacterium]|nr:3'-5' exonuclease [bacterium]